MFSFLLNNCNIFKLYIHIYIRRVHISRVGDKIFFFYSHIIHITFGFGAAASGSVYTVYDVCSNMCTCY